MFCSSLPRKFCYSFFKFQIWITKYFILFEWGKKTWSIQFKNWWFSCLSEILLFGVYLHFPFRYVLFKYINTQNKRCIWEKRQESPFLSCWLLFAGNKTTFNSLVHILQCALLLLYIYLFNIRNLYKPCSF